MALIKCAECGHMISEKAAKCPKCGCPIEYSLTPPEITMPPVPPIAAEETAATPPPFHPKEPEEVAPQLNTPQLNILEPETDSPEPEEENSSRNKNIIIGVIVGVVAALIAGGCVYFFLSRHNTTSDQQEVAQEEITQEEAAEKEIDVEDSPYAREDEEKVVEDNTTVSDPSGKINGYGYVDLGLSVKWATKNLGAEEKPQEYGGYYAWGETSVKSKYIIGNSKTYGNSEIEDISGNSNYDAARALWGGSWRMPTFTEMEELVSKCSWNWTGSGYKVTGPNGNSIYLPAAGYFEQDEVICKVTDGSYWSASDGGGEYAVWLRFDEQEREVVGVTRYLGCTIRPVTD